MCIYEAEALAGICRVAFAPWGKGVEGGGTYSRIRDPEWAAAVILVSGSETGSLELDVCDLKS